MFGVSKKGRERLNGCMMPDDSTCGLRVCDAPVPGDPLKLYS